MKIHPSFHWYHRTYSNRAAYCEPGGEICVSRSRLINVENSGAIQREWAIFSTAFAESRDSQSSASTAVSLVFVSDAWIFHGNYKLHGTRGMPGWEPPRIASNFWRTIDVSRHFLATATAENAKFQSHSNNYSRSVSNARDTVNSRNKIVVNCRQ